MANRGLFASAGRGKLAPRADTVNEAGGRAYSMTPKAALAQIACTGCLNGTYYVDEETQLKTVLRLADLVHQEVGGNLFLARLAVYARHCGFMKDVPALLLAILSRWDPNLFRTIFDKVVTNGKMLRTFVQIIRSGVTGRKSLGTAPKKCIQGWLENAAFEKLVNAVGNDPSIGDVVKLAHPKAWTRERAALLGWLMGKEIDREKLPTIVTELEDFRRGKMPGPPDLDFRLLTSTDLSEDQWVSIAKCASWQTARMNLNTFARHGVFKHSDVVMHLEKLLRSREEIARSHVFPYQLLTTFLFVESDVPTILKSALQDALDISIANVPDFGDRLVWVCPDLSGSMDSPVTGERKGATTKVSCKDVAGLFAASLLKRCGRIGVIPFTSDVVKVDLNPRDSAMTLAQQITRAASGWTNCSAPLAFLNKFNSPGDLVILISDNESWVDSGGRRGLSGGGGTMLMAQWNAFRARNPKAKLVCLDLQPNTTVQAIDREDILNVGGFSDNVWKVIGAFVEGNLSEKFWLDTIASIVI